MKITTRLSRLKTLSAAASLGLAFLVSSCDRSPSGKISNKAPAPEEQKLVLLTWEEYLAPEVQEKFEAETGIAIEFEYYENLPQMKALMQSRPDAFDVVIIDGASLGEAIELQLLQPIDRSLVTKFNNLDAKYLDLDFDPGNEFSVPYTWGTTLIAYRSDRLEAPEESWNLLWENSLNGKVVMLEEKDDLYGLTLLSLGYSLNSEEPDEIAACTKKLVAQIDHLAVRYDDIISARELITDDKCWAFVAYSGDAAVIAAEDENIAYFIPKEGAPLWVDSFAVLREAPNRKAAHQFIDFMTRAEIAGENANYLWYATPNKAAEKFLNEDLREDKSIYPDPEVLARCDFIKKPSAERMRLMNQGMKRIFDRLRDSSKPKSSATAAR